MSDPRLEAGMLLDGRYRLRGLLGAGGMGQVYEAEDMRLGRRVAIKVIHAQYEDDETLAERLFREAKAAARTDHPAVITTYGYGSDDERAIRYVVMERLVGETLAARLESQGALSIELVTRIGLELADVLVAVHAAGVVHRDLKPANVFLATRGMRKDEVKLLDFGVAKQLDMQTLTTTGQVYGTPAYMAPEQLADSKRVDARCDLYSLGAVLFECLAGRRPFTASNAALLVADILTGQHPALLELRSDAPVALVDIIERCLQRRPRDRFADAESVRSALAALP